MKNAFLNGDLEEKFLMHMPTWYVKREKCCKLKNVLNGLRPSEFGLRDWVNMKKQRYIQSNTHHTLFIKKKNDSFYSLCLYRWYDIEEKWHGNDEKKIKKLKRILALEFEFKDLGRLIYFFGIEIACSSTSVVIN